MRRREFIAGLGGTAVWSFAARAQQRPVIGFFRSTTPFENLVIAFAQGLKETGFVEGQNVTTEYRYANNQMDRLPGIVADLLGRPPAVIVGDTIAMMAVKAGTTTVPIVFATGGDPVGQGLVPSLNRPGGNVTGVAFRDPVGNEAIGASAAACAQGDGNRLCSQIPTVPTPRRSARDTEAAGRRPSTSNLSVGSTAIVTLRPHLRRSSAAGRVRMLVGSGTFLIPTVNALSRWRLAIAYPRCIQREVGCGRRPDELWDQV